MSTDFADAARRHCMDACLLFRHRRWPNCDQLYGFAAECALKAIMQSLGMPLRHGGVPDEPRHRVHIDRLWAEFVSFARGREAGKYAALLPSENPFADWSVAQRYYRTDSIREETVRKHQEGVAFVFRAFSLARQDGRIP